MSQVPSHRVRSFLRQELPRWRAEGILDLASEQLLEKRYGLDQEDPAGGLAVAALYVLAACLVGGGIISLVAWHWDDMSRWSRLALLGSALVAAHVAGFRLWKVTCRQPRLGHAVSLLGTILFGASIALIAQIFQVSGPWYGAFGAWAVGALVAGVVLPSLPALCLAAFLGLFVWGPGFISDNASVGDLVAWLAGGSSLALAFRFRSRVVFLLSAAGLGLVLAVAAAEQSGDPSSSPAAVVFAALLAVAAASCALGTWRTEGAAGRLAPAAAWLGRLGLYVVAYALSFEEVARDVVQHASTWPRAWLTCALPPAAMAIALHAAGRRTPAAATPLRFTAAVAVAVPPLFVLAAQARAQPLYLGVLTNVALLATASAWIAHGLATRSRLAFWEGLAVAGLVAVSRFFEIERLLWLKGAGFIACGLAVVAAALAFERGLRSQDLEAHHG